MRVGSSEVGVCAHQFLAGLAQLHDAAREKHSVDTPTAPGTAAVLYRATDGLSTGKTKISTLVRVRTNQIMPHDIPAFQQAYLAQTRTHLAAMLTKRDKAKERRVDKLLVASRKKLEENGGKVLVAGAKRGAGRRKRQRALHRAQRLRTQRAAAAAGHS